MIIHTASFGNSRTLTDSFAIDDESPLSHDGLYTTTNYSNYVSSTPARILDLYSHVVSQVVELITQGKTTQSGAFEQRAIARSVSISKLNDNYFTGINTPTRIKVKILGDTRCYTYNDPRGCTAGFSIGVGVDPSTKIGLWVSIIHTRVTVAAGGQRITVCAGTTPFATDLMTEQTIVNESASPENTYYNADFLVYRDKVELKIWVSTGSAPANYTTYTYSTTSTATKNSIYLSQKSFYEGFGTYGSYTDNPVVHKLDDLEIDVMG